MGVGKIISNISLWIDSTSLNRHHKVLTLGKVAMKVKVYKYKALVPLVSDYSL